jgi:hypothetical protein
MTISKMKKRLIPILLTLTSGFASAASLSDLLNQLDSSLIIFSAIFVISFLIFQLSLSKIFKEQKSTGTIISAILAFLIIFGINQTGWDIQNFFFELGFSEDALFTVIPLILLVGIIFLFIKLKKKKYFFYILGGFLVALGLFIFEEAAEILVIGIVLIIVGLIGKSFLKFMKTTLGSGKRNRTSNSSTTTTS